jgi:hypothetical protein
MDLFGGTLTATGVTFSDNSGGFGSGVFLLSGEDVVLTRVTFDRNNGGGTLYVIDNFRVMSDSPLTLADVTFTNNISATNAGIVLCNAGFSGSGLAFSGNVGADVSTDNGLDESPCPQPQP